MTFNYTTEGTKGFIDRHSDTWTAIAILERLDGASRGCWDVILTTDFGETHRSRGCPRG